MGGGDSARQHVTEAPSISLLGLALVESIKTRTLSQLIEVFVCTAKVQ